MRERHRTVRCSRRQALRGALAGTAALCAGLAPAGCRTQTAALPDPANPRVTLVWQPWRVGWGKGWEQIFYAATRSFREQNRGVDIAVDSSVSGHQWSDDGFVITQILAGTPPDVFSGFGPEKMIESGYLLDLTDAIRQANFDLRVFDKGQIDHYRRPGGLFALPAELSTTCLAVNLGILDEAGLPYPEPGWSLDEAVRIWRLSTVPGKRVGATYWSEGGQCPGNYYWDGWGASIVDPADNTRCAVDRQQAIDFAEWFYELYTAGVAGFSGDLATGHATSVTVGSWSLPQVVTQWQGLKYDFYPYPAWPAGETSYAGRDYYAIPVTARHPEEATSFLLWLMSPEWQRVMMRLQLVIPSIRTLWPEWVETVRQIAPPLATKNLQAFTSAAFKDRAFTMTAFGYASDRAYGQLFNWTQKIAGKQIDPRGGLVQAAAQVNALEQAAATEASATVAMGKRFPTDGPAIAPVPAGV